MKWLQRLFGALAEVTSRRDASGLDEGTCENCGAAFEYRLIHSGFDETIYVYCDSCGTLLLISTADQRAASQRAQPGWAGVIDASIESSIPPCSCGGRFVRAAVPRCPSCHQQLDADLAAKWMESNAQANREQPGSWHWQRCWNGCYCIAIGDRYTSIPQAGAVPDDRR